MIDAGRLRERISIERQAQGDDGYGNVRAGWAELFACWADIRETLGKERVDAGRVEAANTATIRIRSSIQSRGITAADRIVARGAVWNIRSVVPVGNMNAMLDILCERGVAT